MKTDNFFRDKKNVSVFLRENWLFKEVLKIFCGIIVYRYYNFNQAMSTLPCISLNVTCTDIFAKQYFVPLDTSVSGFSSSAVKPAFSWQEGSACRRSQ